jgi:hypothetical protein
MDQAKSVIATFRRYFDISPSVHNDWDGTEFGYGFVGISPRGSCIYSYTDFGTTTTICEGTRYYLGETVTLTATPAEGSTFERWESNVGGICAEITNPQCQFTVEDSLPKQFSISAWFAP